MPETSLIHNPENPLLPNLSKALLIAGGLGFASILTTLAFNSNGYSEIELRDKVCRMTGQGRDPNGGRAILQAAHLYHDNGPLGGYNSSDNGLMMGACAHAFQHWLIYKWRVGAEFGLLASDSFTASSSCLQTSKVSFKRADKEGHFFPLGRTSLEEDHLLKIALYNASWLAGLRGYRLDRSGKIAGEFAYTNKVNRHKKWRPPRRDDKIPKHQEPVSAITRYRRMTMEERLHEVNYVMGRLNGDRSSIMRHFVFDPKEGANGSNVPDVHDLVKIYTRYTFQK